MKSSMLHVITFVVFASAVALVQADDSPTFGHVGLSRTRTQNV